MGVDDDHCAVRFPGLFADRYVGYAACRLRFTAAAVPGDLVSRLRLVAITPEARVLVSAPVRSSGSCPGAREPGESLADLARRELLEEAGAALLTSNDISVVLGDGFASAGESPMPRERRSII